MTCEEIIAELTKLKKRIDFLNERQNNKGKVLKKIYTKENTELFFEALEHEYENLLERKYWDKIDTLIEKLKDPDLSELGAFPFNKKFLENL